MASSVSQWALKPFSILNRTAIVAKSLADDTTAFSSCTAIFKVLAPLLAQVSPVASKIATNLFVSETGLRESADRFAPIGLGLAGIGSLAKAIENHMEDKSPVINFLNGAYFGAAAPVFGLKRVFDLTASSTGSKEWVNVENLCAAAAGILGVLFAANSLDATWQDDPVAYQPRVDSKVWKAPLEHDNEEPVSRGVWMQRCKLLAGSLLIASAIVPYLKGPGAKLPLFRSINSGTFLSLAAAARGALYLVAGVLAMDLFKMRKDSEGDFYSNVPELNARAFDEGKLDEEKFQNISKGYKSEVERHFENKYEFGIGAWAIEGLKYVGEQASSYSWNSRVSKVAGAGLAITSRIAEILGRTPLAAWSLATALRLREGRQITKLSALISTPQLFFSKLGVTCADVYEAGLPKSLEDVLNYTVVIFDRTLGPLADMMSRGGGALLFVSAKAGYPLSGRVQAMVSSASKKWFIVPAALGLAAEMFIDGHIDEEGSLKKILSDVKLWAQKSEEEEYEASSKDILKVADLSIRTGLTALAAINWARGGETKNLALAFALLEGAGAALKLSKDWSDWMLKRKRDFYVQDLYS
jgi:hypothetical protein